MKMTLISEPVQNAPTIEYLPSRFDTLSVPLPGGPMLVNVEYGARGFVVSEKFLGLFGEAKTVEGAIRDLIKHMTLTLDDLELHEDTLSEDLRSDLAALRFFLRE
jgi:hypothetical protein